MKANCKSHDAYEDGCIDCGLASVSASPASPCSPFPLLIAQFEQVLKETGLVDAAAIEDPHGFDNFATQAAIYQAWAKLHRIIVANSQEQSSHSD